MWKGSGLPTREQNIRILGTPLGQADFVAAQLQERLQDHQLLLDRIPEVPDLQSAWALLLHCASARANYFLRVVRPELVSEVAEGHDEGLWRCLCRMLWTDFGNEHSHEVASMPLSLGGLGLRSATRTRQAAYGASWADCLVAERILVALHSFEGAEST